ncbi:DUF2382 domain-containing protein [Gordonia sp. CPCC 205333]|uniref:DUF2382 domain-containing protein n=1 Tax=Gordonia sp. CPCC 205333 TaxID=3140790 RepID=UPI003AF33496
MIVTFAGYDIKVGTPVVSRDGAEVGTVDSTIGEDLVVNVTTAGTQLLLTESGVAAFEPDFIRLEKTAADISAGNYDKVGEPEPAPEPVTVADPEPVAAEPATAENEAAAPVGLLSTPSDAPATDAPAPVDEPAPEEVAAPQADEPVADDAPAEDAPADSAVPAAATGTPTAGGQTIHLHAEDLIAAKRQVATGVVKVAKKVLLEDKAVDVDVFTEKVTVNRVDLDEDADVEYAFEEGVFEIELKGEEVEVGKRVRRVGQVEVGKERLTTTQRVTGQTRREEIEVNEEAYDASRPDGDVYDPIVAKRLTDTD